MLEASFSEQEQTIQYNH